MFVGIPSKQVEKSTCLKLILQILFTPKFLRTNNIEQELGEVKNIKLCIQRHNESKLKKIIYEKDKIFL